MGKFWNAVKSGAQKAIVGTMVGAAVVTGAISGFLSHFESPGYVGNLQGGTDQYCLQKGVVTSSPDYYLVKLNNDRYYAIPSNAIPSNAIPSNFRKEWAIPSNSQSVFAIPSNAIPSNFTTYAIPSNAIPSNITVSNVRFFDTKEAIEGLLADIRSSQAIPSNAVQKALLKADLKTSMLSSQTAGQLQFDQISQRNINIPGLKGMRSITCQEPILMPLSDRICKHGCIQVKGFVNASAFSSEPSPSSPPSGPSTDSSSAVCDENLDQANVYAGSGGESPNLIINVTHSGGFIAQDYEMLVGGEMFECEFYNDTRVYCYGDPLPPGSTYVTVILYPLGQSCPLIAQSIQVQASDHAQEEEVIPPPSGEETASCPEGKTYHPPNSIYDGGCCSVGHWCTLSGDSEPACWEYCPGVEIVPVSCPSEEPSRDDMDWYAYWCTCNGGEMYYPPAGAEQAPFCEFP